MAKKKKLEKIKHKPTKGQVSRWEKQKKRQRNITIIGTAIISVVLLVLSVGLVTQWYIPVYKVSKEEAIKVNDITYDMAYFVDAVKYYSGGNPQYVNYVIDFAIERIPKDTLVRQQAKEMGYSVTSEEIKDYIKENELDGNDFIKDVAEAQLLLEKMRQEYFDPQIPTNMEHRELLAMFLESEAEINDLLQKIESGEDFSALAEEFSLDSYTASEKGEIDWMPEEIISKRLLSDVVAEQMFNAAKDEFNPPVYDEAKTKGLGYWLIELLEKNTEEDKVLVKAMLLSSEEQALEIRQRLVDGEDFSELAKEFSQLAEVEDNGGQLDWVGRGDLGSVFDQFAFSQDTSLGEISEPLADEGRTTSGGYWLFKVTGINENMQVSEDDRLLFVNDLINEWVVSLEEDASNTIEILLDDELRLFAIEQASKV